VRARCIDRVYLSVAWIMLAKGASRQASLLLLRSVPVVSSSARPLSRVHDCGTRQMPSVYEIDRTATATLLQTLLCAPRPSAVARGNNGRVREPRMPRGRGSRHIRLTVPGAGP
jgi:hypothetical protein